MVRIKLDRIKLDKSVITAFDNRACRELGTEDSVRNPCNGKPLIHLAAEESLTYLEVHASLITSWMCCALSRGLASEKDQVFSAAEELLGIANDHKYLLRQWYRSHIWAHLPASATRCHSSTGAKHIEMTLCRPNERRGT